MGNIYQKYIRHFKIPMSWNQYSDDSWMESDSGSDKDQQQQNTHTQNTSVKTQTQHNEGNVTDKKQEKEGQSKVQQTKSKPKGERNVEKKDRTKFPTDEQLLEQFEAGKIQENLRLKIVNCHQKQEKQKLEAEQKAKTIKKLKQYKPNCYVVTFWKKEDLIKFIKQKIEKNYKFKVGVYVITEKEKQLKAQREKQLAEKKERQEKQARDRPKVEYKAKHFQSQTQGNSRENRQKKQVRDTKQGDKNKYRDEKDTEERPQKRRYHKKQSKQYQEKDENRNKDYKQPRKQDQKGDRGEKHDKKQDKKHKQPVKSVERENDRTNIVKVVSSQDSPAEVVDWLKSNKITNQFSKFQFIAPGNLLDYVEKICQECYRTIKFGLTSQIDEQKCQQAPEQSVRFIMQENQKNRPIKRNIPTAYISKINNYNDFELVQKCNIQVIGNDKNSFEKETEFDEKQYMELFKKNYPKIVPKWEKWIIYAYGTNIAKLLRLSGLIKKTLPKNELKYEVGVNQNKVPFTKLQIIDLQKTGKRVDTSVINSHLQDF